MVLINSHVLIAVLLLPFTCLLLLPQPLLLTQYTSAAAAAVVAAAAASVQVALRPKTEVAGGLVCFCSCLTAPV